MQRRFWIGYAVLLLLAILAGCKSVVVTPPPPPSTTVNVKFTWTGPGNPLAACPVGTSVGIPNVHAPCNYSYSLVEKPQGMLLNNISITESTYEAENLPASTSAQSFGLWVNILEPDGSLAESAVALTAVVLK